MANENNENVSEVETLLNSNEVFTKEKLEKLFESEDECKKCRDELIEFDNSHVPFDDIIDPDGEYKSIEIKDIDSYIRVMNEFRLDARKAIMAEKNKLLFVIREEELYSTIDKLQKDIDDYDNYVKEHGEEDASRHYTNQQLNQISVTRTQSIPMYIIELETLSSAIIDNDKTYEKSSVRARGFCTALIKFFDSKLAK